jgi:hypothetical protein
MKKYKLVGNNQQTGGGFEVVYPVIPSMTGLMPTGVPPIKSRVVMGGPMPGFFPGAPSAPYMTTGRDGLKVGIPLTSAFNTGMNVIIPPKIDPRDPSVFMAMAPSSSTPKTLKADSDVRMTFSEAQPKQSLLMFQPNLPTLPLPSVFGNLSLPVGMSAGPSILLNPNESKSKIEITSPDSDDIITLSGEQDKIKPIYEGILANNKVKKAQNEITLAGKEFENVKTKVKGGTWDFETELKPKTDAELAALVTSGDLNEPQRKAVVGLQKAKKDLQTAKKSAGLADDDTDTAAGDLLPLTELFDISKVIAELGKLKITGFDAKNVNIATKKQPTMPFMFGMPAPGFGPVVSFS